MKRQNLLLLAALAISLSLPAQAQRGKRGQALDGTLLAQSCMACHGTNGSSVAGPMPSIAGQPEVFFNNTMAAFRDGSRPSTVMGRIAKGYTEQETAAIAKYFGEKPFLRKDQGIPAATADLGRKAYEKACKRCHPDNGRDFAEAEYPILAGQWLGSMQIAIADIRGGKRKVDSKFLSKLDELTPEEVDAALHFFASQK